LPRDPSKASRLSGRQSAAAPPAGQGAAHNDRRGPPMPLVKLAIAPGIVKGNTEFASSGRWVDSNRTRFVGGLPEKLGGWSKLLATPLAGVPRAAHGWRDSTGNRRLIFGTHRKAQVYYDAALYDITPAVASGNLTNPFSTTSGSALVTVTHTAHGRQGGD